jgi:hypothetical protein
MMTVQESTIGEWLGRALTKPPQNLTDLHKGTPHLTAEFKMRVSNQKIEDYILEALRNLGLEIYQPTRELPRRELQVVFASSVTDPPGRLVAVNSVDTGVVIVSLFYEYPRPALFLLTYGVVRHWDPSPPRLACA